MKTKKISYRAVIRNASGHLQSNSAIGLKITKLQDLGAMGMYPVYAETQTLNFIKYYRLLQLHIHSKSFSAPIDLVVAHFQMQLERQQYYIAIKPQNSIQTWSANPVKMSNVVYAFSAYASSAYGNNQKQVDPNVFAMYCGDIIQDEVIDGSDYTLWEANANGFVSVVKS